MKIVQIRTTPLALPLREPYHWAGRVDTSFELDWDAVGRAAERYRRH